MHNFVLFFFLFTRLCKKITIGPVKCSAVDDNVQFFCHACISWCYLAASQRDDRVADGWCDRAEKQQGESILGGIIAQIFFPVLARCSSSGLHYFSFGELAVSENVVTVGNFSWADLILAASWRREKAKGKAKKSVCLLTKYSSLAVIFRLFFLRRSSKAECSRYPG